MADLAVVILTYNETLHLARALESIAPIAKEVFVVDSNSTDDTVAIAKAHGAQVLTNTFVNYSRQFQWALDNAPISARWVMRLDADEIVEPDLAAEIAARLSELPDDVNGINLKRKTIFLGRWIKHGGRYPLTLLRIWRKGTAHIEDRWMDEHMVLDSGRTVTFDGGFADHNLNNLAYFTEKHSKYATREAIDALNRRYHFLSGKLALDAESTAPQAAFKRFIKNGIYYKMPFELSSAAYFLYRYVLRLGFLDGRAGLTYHVLQGYWYRFLVGARTAELERELDGIREPRAMRAKLSRLTGFRTEEP